MDIDQCPKLEGGWVKICKAGKEGPDAKLTCDDLDDVVRNYQPREKKAPIGVGRNWAGAKPYGQVDEVRRDGSYLLGKLSNVDPRMEDLHKAGAFKKKAVSLQKTPHGLSLERVGFLDDDQGSKVSSIDDLHKAEFRRHEVLHAENRPRLGKFIEFTSDLPSSDDHESNAVSHLKGNGLWSPTFDAFSFPWLLGELERTNRNAARVPSVGLRRAEEIPSGGRARECLRRCRFDRHRVGRPRGRGGRRSRQTHQFVVTPSSRAGGGRRGRGWLVLLGWRR